MGFGDFRTAEIVGALVLIAVILAGFMVVADYAGLSESPITAQSVRKTLTTVSWVVLSAGIIAALLFIMALIKFWPSGGM